MEQMADRTDVKSQILKALKSTKMSAEEGDVINTRIMEGIRPEIIGKINGKSKIKRGVSISSHLIADRIKETHEDSNQKVADYITVEEVRRPGKSHFKKQVDFGSDIDSH